MVILARAGFKAKAKEDSEHINQVKHRRFYMEGNLYRKLWTHKPNLWVLMNLISGYVKWLWVKSVVP